METFDDDPSGGGDPLYDLVDVDLRPHVQKAILQYCILMLLRKSCVISLITILTTPHKKAYPNTN